MRRTFGFTLIEVMVVVAIIGILTVVAYPSYQDYVRRGIRSQGQQYLMDIAQREEQFLLDRRLYTNDLTTATGLDLPLPPAIVPYYQGAVVTLIAGPPQGFRVRLEPVASNIMAADGRLLINNFQQRWRETDGSNAYGTNDCLWEATRCKPS